MSRPARGRTALDPGVPLFDIIFLGTSASAPSVHRGLSAQVVSFRDYRFLIDCGEGTQRQILQSGIGFKRLNKILITHGHLDHILGLAGLLSTFSRWEAIDELEIYGGAWALGRLHDLGFGVGVRGGRPPRDPSRRAPGEPRASPRTRTSRNAPGTRWRRRPDRWAGKRLPGGGY